MSQLPCELWCLIASLARLRDLPSLSRVSNMASKASSQALYRDVTLKDSEHLDDTVRLLQDPAMARKVQRLTLRGIPASRRISRIFPIHDVVNIMLNLRSIAIVSCTPFFFDAQDQERFIRTLMISCRKLTEIQYKDSGHPPTDDFSMASISRVVWNEVGGFTRPLLSLCRASASTITHLSIPTRLDLFSVESLLAFSTMEFPRLSSLQLGPWLHSDSPEIPTALTVFLSAHPTIEYLHLMYDPYSRLSNPDFQISLDFEAMSPKILPNLKTLDAHPENIRKFLAVRATCLATMPSLSISHGMSPNTVDSVTDMVDELMGYVDRHGVAGVREMKLYLGLFSSDMSMNDYNEWMLAFATAFPQLDTWMGDVPGRMGLGIFIRIFSRFRSLRVLDLKGWPPSDRERLAKTDTIRNLADECSSLQQAKFRGPEGELVDMLHISRDPEFGISVRWVDIDDEL